MNLPDFLQQRSKDASRSLRRAAGLLLAAGIGLGVVSPGAGAQATLPICIATDYMEWSGTVSSGTAAIDATSVPILPNLTYTNVNSGSNTITLTTAESVTAQGGTSNSWANSLGSPDASEDTRYQVRLGSGYSTQQQTITFVTPTPSNSWGFMMADVDVEQVKIEAFDNGGTQYSNAEVSSWYVTNFDRDSSDGNNLPVWIGPGQPYVMGAGTNGTSGALTAPRSSNLGGGDESNGASIWFAPDVPIKRLRLTYENVAGATPSVRMYIASCTSPNLTLAKSSNGPWTIGQTGAQYTLTPRNTATGTPTQGLVTVSDTLPTGITPNWMGTLTTNGWSCTFSGQLVACNSSAQILANSTGGLIVLPVNVTASTPTGTNSITNYASISGGGDPRVITNPNSSSCAPSGMCASTATTVIPSADLSISKVGSSSLVQGSTATYIIKVWNQGPNTVTGATIADNVPSNLTNVNWTCAANVTASCGTTTSGTNNNAISFVSGLLPVNASTTPPTTGSYLTITVTGTASNTGSFTNTATVTAPSGTTDPVSGNDNSSQATTITVPPTCVSSGFTKVRDAITGINDRPNGDLLLTPNKSGQIGAAWSNTLADLNNPFNYKVKVYLGNDDNGADGLTFTFQNDPRGLQAIGSEGRSLAAGFDVAQAGGIKPSLIIELDTYQNGDTGWNDPAGDHIAAYLNGDSRHLTTSPNFLTAPTVVPNLEDGQYHDFRIVWTPGPVNTQTGTLEYYLDGTLYGTINRDIRVDLGTSSPYWGYTASTGSFFNEQVVCNQNVIPAPVADLMVNKTGPSTVVQGSLATYTITVWNKGPGNSTGATISDPVPSNLTNVNWSCAASGTAACGTASGSGNTISFVSGILPVNASTTPPTSGSYLTLTVTGTATTTGTLTNTATVTVAPGVTDPGVPSTSSQTTVITTPVVVQPVIDLKKYVRNVTSGTSFVDTNVTAKPKDIVEYCITYENTGGNAANFKITDNVPAGMFVLAAATPDLSNAYGAGSSISWSSTSNTVAGTAPPAGSTALTNAPDSDQGTLTATGGTYSKGVLTLDLSSTGLPNGGRGTVCFQTQVP
jgi:uncharacterized repeat protein (TIGR01451 family)